MIRIMIHVLLILPNTDYIAVKRVTSCVELIELHFTKCKSWLCRLLIYRIWSSI